MKKPKQTTKSGSLRDAAFKLGCDDSESVFDAKLEPVSKAKLKPNGKKAVSWLGNLIYWSCGGVATIVFLLSLWAGLMGHTYPPAERYIRLGVFAIFGSLVWLAGRATRHLVEI